MLSRFSMLLICVCGQITAVPAADRPNVLFILTEDQGAHLGLLKTPGLKTPNIDSIAKAGVCFRNAFVAYPVCSASKAALYTALHSHTNGILNNTHNYHKPASEVTLEEKSRRLAKVNCVRNQFATMPELLKRNGYYQAVTHKLHVLPNEKFPYDEFLHGSTQETADFFKRASAKSQPWFLMVNIPNSHRPYPNSDHEPIRVDPEKVKLPAYLPESAEVRNDWAEYLAAIEQADAITGQTLRALKQSGQQNNTIVVFMSDHGPTFQHGKMTLYDLGLRVPLIISGPGIAVPVTRDELVSELDLMPTLLEECGITVSFDYALHGQSISGLLKKDCNGAGHEFIFCEISNRGPLPNDGMQERSVFDGRWKVIYREKAETAWRQVNADSRQFRIWGNRTHVETIRLKDQFPVQYRMLAEMDPQNLAVPVPELELYDLKSDTDEMHDLANDDKYQAVKSRLLTALCEWVEETNDISVSTSAIKARLN